MGACQAKRDPLPTRVFALLRNGAMVSRTQKDMWNPRITNIKKEDKQDGRGLRRAATTVSV
jgi:hypothetical protein